MHAAVALSPPGSQDRSVARRGVLIVHTAAGIGDDFILAQAERVALACGSETVAFVVDMYGAEEGFVTPPRSTQLMAALRADRNAQARRCAAAADALDSLAFGPEVQPGLHDTPAGPLAAVGYCYGGQCVLDLARSNLLAGRLRCAVSMHGILDAPADIKVTPMDTTRVVCCHGACDPFVPRESVAAFEGDMIARGADWTLHAYGEAMHAFTRPDKTEEEHVAAGFQYSPRRDAESFAALLATIEATCTAAVA